MVAESRAARLDLYARTKFTREGQDITESRAVLDELIEGPAGTAARHTAGSLNVAASAGLIETG